MPLKLASYRLFIAPEDKSKRLRKFSQDVRFELHGERDTINGKIREGTTKWIANKKTRVCEAGRGGGLTVLRTLKRVRSAVARCKICSEFSTS